MEKATELYSGLQSFAAIDIGSNAVRLLIKQVVDPGRHPKLNKALLVRVPLRLGFDVFSEGKISEKKEKNLVRLMKSYKQLMKIYGTDVYRACATSAMRDAANGQQIIKRVEKASGIKIEIIDGQEEARIVYENHIENMKGRKGNYMYVDVGGGSTEINLISDGGLVCSRSYNIGTVRILNNAATENEWKRLKKDMKDLSVSYPGIELIGSGGNINKLVKMVKGRDKRYPKMTVASLKELYDTLKGLSVDERIESFDLKPDRADVIVPAAEIFLTIADILGSTTIYVPVIGLADGIIDDLYLKSCVRDSSDPCLQNRLCEG
ncbi:MAG: rod shape-determining protein [Bacteroidetes bacterium]|uniref:Rod shape-determining protein n=1 Tax=Candidatus Cryptobacteroides faecipullorum TaxID=2840764 RepID=A0A9D9IA96_9BACT|nr:rod shape-determining protein [Candidatus Cryptobacteroides faecipullorum]